MSQRIAWNKGLKTGLIPKTAFKQGDHLINLPEDRIIKLYQEGLTCRQIGKLFQVSHHLVSRRLYKYNISLRSKSEDKFLWKNHSYQGKNTQRIWIRESFKLFPHVCNRCGEFEKRLIVHHKDHNRKNNSLDGKNWEILCHSCHSFHHKQNSIKSIY